MSKQFFLGRQPILDREQNLIAFELLFRSSQENRAQFFDDFTATTTVIQYAFGELGVGRVLGKHLGFINISDDMLLSDIIEILPPSQVVLELLETTSLNDEVIARCKELNERGYQIALDDVISFDSKMIRVMPYVSYVKLDILATPPEKLPLILRQLRQFPVKLLAEKIDTQEQKQNCLDLGFDLFQGYHFAKPTILSGRPCSPSDMHLMRLLGLVNQDADVEEIEKLLKQAPDLSISLLKLVNSVACGLRNKVTSLRNAVIALGQQQLGRWLQLLLFARHAQNDPYAGTLLQLTAIRGKMMELAAKKLYRMNPEYHDMAFMVGILSLVESVLGQPLEEIIPPLNLAGEVSAALLYRSNKLGHLLQIIEATEQNDSDIEGLLVGEFAQLDANALNEFQAKAMLWAEEMNEEN